MISLPCRPSPLRHRAKWITGHSTPLSLLCSSCPLAFALHQSSQLTCCFSVIQYPAHCFVAPFSVFFFTHHRPPHAPAFHHSDSPPPPFILSAPPPSSIPFRSVPPSHRAAKMKVSRRPFTSCICRLPPFPEHGFVSRCSFWVGCTAGSAPPAAMCSRTWEAVRSPLSVSVHVDSNLTCSSVDTVPRLSWDALCVWVAGGTCNCLAGRPSLDEDPRRSRRQYEPFKARSLRLDAEVLFDGDGGSGGGDPAMEVLFGGLLTVGTLGTGSWPIEEKGEEDDAATNGEVDEKKLMVLAVEELVTPAALEAIAEEEAEATERDLTVVGAELEKVLPTEAEKGGGGMSSARSSHSGAAACPLQGLLFGSPIETASAVAGGRKERRASLGELIMMSRIAEGGGVRAEEAEIAGLDSGRDGERKPTAEMCMMRTKIAKHRNGSDGGGVSTNGSTVETKIQKVRITRSPFIFAQ
ncbi:hypothetical protein BHE74_00003902 [Ensete ventricosum]|nr:hypothetical protein BHE74_00003902 [Ensete ventricosum]